MDVLGPTEPLRPGVATVFSADSSLACVRFIRDLDSNSWRLLAGLHRQLSLHAPRRILCDLAPTTFAGVSLMACFARLATETSATVILCRPTDQAAGVILMTDVFRVAQVSDDLPPDWIEPSHANLLVND